MWVICRIPRSPDALPRPIAQQQLTIPMTFGGVHQIDQGPMHCEGLRFYIIDAGPAVAQAEVRDAGVGRGRTSVWSHRPSISGSAFRIARAPMPVPPLLRAGALDGFQP